MTDLAFCTRPMCARSWKSPILRMGVEGNFTNYMTQIFGQIFVTSMLELTLNAHSMFEWQCHSQESTDVPPYQQLLGFIDLRAQALESTVSDAVKPTLKSDASTKKNFTPGKSVASFTANAE